MATSSPPRDEALSHAIALGALGVLCAAVVYGDALAHASADRVVPLLSSRLVVDLLLGAAALILFALRGRAPGVLLPLIVLASAASASALPAAAAAVISTASRRRPAQTVFTAGLFILAANAEQLVRALSGMIGAEPPFPLLHHALPAWQELAATIGITIVLVLWGLLRASRRDLAASAAARSDSEHRAQEALVDRARLRERARIAREMHDALGHRLSLMAVHAGALEYREDLDAARIRETAAIIREQSRLGLTDLRRTIGALRAAEDEAPDAADGALEPARTVDALLRLIEEGREAGDRIDVELRLPDDPLPAGTVAVLHRILQEGLTNARRHAPGEPVALVLAGDRDHVRLSLRNPVRRVTTPATASAAATGYGLVGIRERVRLAGGTVSAGPAGAPGLGAFVVEVELPWTT